MAEVNSVSKMVNYPISNYKDMSDEEFRKFVVDYLYTLYEFSKKAIFEASGKTIGIYDYTLERKLKEAMDFWERDSSNEHRGF